MNRSGFGTSGEPACHGGKDEAFIYVYCECECSPGNHRINAFIVERHVETSLSPSAEEPKHRCGGGNCENFSDFKIKDDAKVLLLF